MFLREVELKSAGVIVVVVGIRVQELALFYCMGFVQYYEGVSPSLYPSGEDSLGAFVWNNDHSVCSTPNCATTANTVHNKQQPQFCCHLCGFRLPGVLPQSFRESLAFGQTE